MRLARAFGISAAIAIVALLSLSTPGTSALAQTDGPDAADRREVVVILNTGERIRGDLVREDSSALVLEIASIETRIPRDQVDQVIVQRPAIERYREMRAIIDDSDINRRLLLVEWCRDHDLLEQALAEVKGVLSLEPNNGEAIRLERLVERELILRERRSRAEREERRDTTAPPNGQGGETDDDRPQRPLPGEFPLLNDEQINLYKVYEVDLDDPPRLLIERDTVTRLLNQYASSDLVPASREGRDAFHRKEPVEILETMFRLRARELYGEVAVRGLPESLRMFRDDVNATWLVNGCATTRCHGGSEAGRFLLYNRSPTSEQATVTNLMILERFKMGGSAGQSLISYARPETSPLLQLGLPRDDSASPHPEVDGWRPVFRSRDDRRFLQAVEWLRSMHRPRPEIPIQYEPPTWADIEKARDSSEPQADEPGEQEPAPDR